MAIEEMVDADFKMCTYISAVSKNQITTLERKEFLRPEQMSNHPGTLIMRNPLHL